MRPIALKLQAFGPYAEQEAVDFAALGSAALFLIHGPTGAGKSSLLDAMTFALYGNDSANARSHFAKPALLTQVDFTFAVGTTEYIVSRKPQQEIAKQRGTGTTTKPAEAELWRVAEGGNQILATKAKEVTDQIEQMLGLEVQQFRQVVLLPQGEFARFLVAPSAEKEKILGVLFRTQYYQRLVDAIRTEQTELQREMERLDAQSKAIRDQMGQAAAEELEARRKELAPEIEAAAKGLEGAQQALAAANQLASLFAAYEKAKADAAKLAAQAATFEAMAVRLDAARKAAPLTPLVEQGEQRRKEMGQAQQALNEATAGVDAARQAMQAAAVASEKIPELEMERERWLPLRDAAGGSPTRGANLALPALPSLAQIAAWQSSSSSLSKLQSRQMELVLQDQAAALVVHLHDGQPCPVCGSPDHPQPVVSANREELLQVQQQIKAAEQAQQRLSTVAPLVQQRLEELGRQIAGARTKLQTAERELAGAEARVAGAQQAQQLAAQAFAQTKQQFLLAMQEAGFADSDAFKAAKMSQGEQERAAAALTQWQGETARVQGQLESLLQQVDGRQAPQLVSLQQAEQSARRQLDMLRQTDARLAEQHRLWLDNHKRLLELAAQLEDVERRLRVTGQVFALASGKNGRKLNLQKFVQTAFLRDVLAAANSRLRVMTRTRFELLHEEQADGLELSVLDYYTGQARSVKTLSGGETFLASLALALGLSDVVQSNAGGIHLDALFVDEGFGTLDPESLDLALHALLALRESGRMVGIISHVAELRERIPVRLEIVPGVTGSHVKFHS